MPARMPFTNNEGIDKGISKRAVQMDIQMMRSEKLGYNAPIVVYENKYYKYEDPEYSITQTPLNEQDLKTMSEAVEVLRQFKGFSYFTEMSEIVNRLEDHVASARMKTTPVIDFEKNESLKGWIIWIPFTMPSSTNIPCNLNTVRSRPVRQTASSSILIY